MNDRPYLYLKYWADENSRCYLYEDMNTEQLARAYTNSICNKDRSIRVSYEDSDLNFTAEKFIPFLLDHLKARGVTPETNPELFA
jgi:hypothetical protein